VRLAQVAQVLLNLLTNALDAVQGTPNPWVKFEVFATNNQRIRFILTDSGPGIPKKNIGKIMQPFFTTKEVGKGTGLGLSISLGIAKSHGGNLWLNQSAKNTQFFFELPIKIPSKVAKKNEAPAA
jgi:C4-dicarboxylate-specific signal transduction histidine kinase